MKTTDTIETKTSSKAIAHKITERGLRYPVVDNLQTKLTIGQAGDKYEQEADRTADKVMSMPDSQFIQARCEACDQEESKQMKPLAASITPWIQKQAVEEEEEESLQTKPNQSESPQLAPDWVQRKLSSGKNNGNPLPDATKSFMETRFGSDFGEVRVHTGSTAVQMNRSLNAQAFTRGKDIYFNSGKYNPESSSGQHLLAHELTHVVQQTGTRKNRKQPFIQKANGTGAAPTMAPPTPSRFSVGACSTPKTLLSDSGSVASGDDFRHFDFPTLPSLPNWKAALVALKRRSTNQANINDMSVELGIHAGSEGLRMVRHFASGGGSRLNHDASSPLGSRARNSADVGRTHRTAGNSLKMQLTAMAASGNIDCNLLNLPAARNPTPGPAGLLPISGRHCPLARAR